MSIMLSDNFTLSEAIESQTATRLGLDNTPSDEAIMNLRRVARDILEPIRREFGPFSPTSWYRSPALNKAIGGATKSQHMAGEAVDIKLPRCTSLGLFLWCRDRINVYDQCILEFWTKGQDNSGWVHISKTYEKNRMKALEIN